MDVLNHEFLLFLRCAQQTGLRYLLIGGYAVNYYGYIRNTDDMDIWIAPTNENKSVFIKTLLCMKYTKSEVADWAEQDFRNPFVGSVGSGAGRIDVLTVVHHKLLFDEAEIEKQVFEIEPGVFMNFVPFRFLRDMKLRSRRPKDLWDVARLEELLNKK